MTQALTTHAQDGLWFLSEVDAGSPAFTRRLAYRVSGPLDTDALSAAWETVVARHDALRTTIGSAGGRPVPRAVTPRLSIVEDEESAAPALGVRATLVRVRRDEHVLVLLLPQAVVDDESAALLVAELSACYAGRPPGPVARYDDFARWQRARVAGAEVRDMLDQGAAALTPPPPPLELPTDRPRPAGPAWRGGAVPFSWPGLRLTEAAGEFGTTPEVVLLAAFQALLHRLSGAEAVCAGLPVSLRRPADAGTVGAFTNLLPLVADFADRPAFGVHVKRLAATTREALARAEVPFDLLVRELAVDRDPRRIPLCDATLARRDEPELTLAGTSVRPVDTGPAAVAADLTLTVGRLDSPVDGSLSYRADLLDESSARRLLGQLRTLLGAGLVRPDVPVDELPLEDPPTIRAAVRAADETAAAPGDGRAVHERVHDFAARHPHATAVAWAGAAVSYGELVRRAAAVTGALRAAGPVEGAAVAVRLPQGPNQIAALLGVLDAGAHLVCLGTGDAGERGRAILADLRPAAILVEDADDDLARWFHAELGGHVVDVSDPSDVDGAGPGRAGELAYVAYTSGSTGRPKGIPTTHATFAQFTGWLAGEFRVGPGARVAQWAAPGYDASLVEVFATLAAGATLCPVPDRIRANPEKIVRWLADETVTLFQTVPSFAREVLRAIVRTGTTLDALDHVLLAGEALPGELAGAFRATLPAARLVNLYGPTESILATWHDVTSAPDGPVPIGRSIPGRQVLVVDDRDRPCPTGVTGHLVIRGPHLTPGYTGAAAGERAAFTPLRDAPGPCYRTGDLARRRWDGLLEFRGRKDFQVKFYGTRVELTDIEAALAEDESVAECAVTAVANAEGLVTKLVAYVVPARDAAGQALGSTQDWRAALARRFGRAKFPVTFQTTIGLPRNLGGKVDRRGLPAPADTTAAPARAMSAPARAIAEIWSELLGAEPAAPDDTFFAAGGHSLLAPLLLGRVRERLGVAVPLWEFLANPTIAGLTALTESQAAVHAVTEPMIG